MTTRTGLIRLLALGLAAAAFLGACGDDDDNPAIETVPDGVTTAPGATQPAASGDGITIKGFTFSAYTAEPGETVTVSNEDSPTHTVTADDGAFDTKEIAGGSTATFTAPDQAGTYTFHCNIHASMTGTLTVG